ncbi:cyclin-dependent protein kinase inhibitor SMR1 [Alnus glutinosa]|uniref:cyclin-dependent protein kinase inhibitor SMR1 n=1 Tax=Alnus glutinosa TaxID=3517 RepID=UPI002D77DFAA|nr:cyclin-dependent protein kinase inhibitor SMR1 [Alnus glutinosa]
MSTDLEFLHDLSKIRLLTVKTRTTAQASKDAAADDIGGNVAVKPQKTEEEEAKENNNNNNNNECRTPTSEEHRIPKILDCPPAPRKPRRVPSCKRKLSPEVQFFEIVNPEEVDAFFRSSFEKISAITSAKRSCCPCK